MPWFVLAKNLLQKRMRRPIPINLSIVERDVLTDVSLLSAVKGLVLLVLTAKTGDSNFIRMHMSIQRKLRRKDGGFLQENLFQKVHLLCSMWEKSSLQTQI